MTRLASEYDAVNLAQGYPDFPCPRELKKAAAKALDQDYNQYSVTWGSPLLREAVARKAEKYNGLEATADKNVVITCGTTEAMVASQLAILNPGDELVIFSPHYENYGPDAIISGARPKYFELDEENGFSIDEEKFKQMFSSKTRGLIVNTPNNPSGKVFSKKELKLIADMCEDYDVICFTDEIYEHILFDNSRHLSIGSFPSMKDRTVTISGFSKTYSVTGWRVGYVVAHEKLADAIKKVHDFLTVGAPHPLQIACVKALSLPSSYYASLRKDYQSKRDLLYDSLRSLGFICSNPAGAYYIWSDYSQIDDVSNDVRFAENLVRDVGVAGVPGSSFYSGRSGRKRIRFTFSKKIETLEIACERMKKGFEKGRVGRD